MNRARKGKIVGSFARNTVEFGSILLAGWSPLTASPVKEAGYEMVSPVTEERFNIKGASFDQVQARQAVSDLIGKKNS